MLLLMPLESQRLSLFDFNNLIICSFASNTYPPLYLVNDDSYALNDDSLTLYNLTLFTYFLLLIIF